MTLLFVDGFDVGDYLLRYGSAGTPVLSSTTRFGVGRSLTSSSRGQLLIKALAPAVNRCIVGMAVRAPGSDGAGDVFVFKGDNNVTTHITIDVTGTGQVTVKRGTNSGTLLATSTTLFSFNTWHYLEASVTISDTTGVVKVRIDGVEVINFTGDTKNAGTNLTIDAVYLGLLDTSSAAFMDDLYIADDTGPAPYNDFLGDVRVHTLVPTGPGATTALTPSVSPNWGCVDELPYSATDYVSSVTVGAKDTYALADLPAGVGTVHAVQTGVIAKKSDAGVKNLKTVLRSGSTDYSDAAATALATSDGQFRNLRTANPNGGAAWNTAAVNALEAGAEVA